MEVKDKVVTVEGLKGAYDNLDGKITQLNSDLNVTTCNVTLLTNSGIIRATKYGKLLIVDGYVTISGQNENKNVEIAKINGIVLKQQTTQFLAQIGNTPISPYCTFGSMRDDGTIVVYSPLNSDSLFRFGFATITR